MIIKKLNPKKWEGTCWTDTLQNRSQRTKTWIGKRSQAEQLEFWDNVKIRATGL